METHKSPENTEVTPNKKKLKQARLPFKILSDVSPQPATQPRKRKLSAPETEIVPKPSKISKENDVIGETLVISDDDSKDEVKTVTDVKLPNPFVKLVDTAIKKKLQKTKKKKTSKKASKTLNSSCEHQANDSKEIKTDLMDVDDTPETDALNHSGIIEKSASAVEDSRTLSTDKTSNITDVVPNLNTFDDYADNETNNDASKDNSTQILDENTPVENTLELNEKSPCENLVKEIDQSNSDQNITPKRNLRNRSNCERNNNSKGSPSSLNDSINSKTSSKSKNNDSICSEVSTPTNVKSATVLTNNQGDVSLNDSTASATLTPKQMQKKLESAKKREERDKKRQQEKEERAKQKQEKEEQKKREREEKEEVKRKEKEEKEEQRRREKEEKEKMKELEKKQKEEKEEQKRKEREEKEEQKKKEKEAKDEEKRKKQEALELEKQEQELKKKKAAEAFVNFFVPKQKSEKDQATICSVGNSMLTNFTIKSDMRLAPLVRVDFSENKKRTLDNALINQAEKVLYLKSLKDKLSMPLTCGKTWPLSDKYEDDDVMIIEDAELQSLDSTAEILTSQSVPCEKLRAKLFSFHENRRPPYWGTWRKKSVAIKPRKPFAQDQKHLDYEVDSDDEWEEEQEGESLDGSAAGSDDEQDGDEYEVDNVVFVPHGYLSDEEATMDEDDVLSLSPETQKARLKHLEDEFESEMKKPTEKLKPRLYGLLWETSDGGKPDKCVDALWNYFRNMSMIMNDPTPLLQPALETDESEKKKVKKKKQATQPDSEQKQKSPKSEKRKKNKQDEVENKTSKIESKKKPTDVKKTQPGINMFLTKMKSS